MGSKRILFATTICVLVGCSNNDGARRRLESGKEIQIRHAGVLDDSFVVQYCTDLPLSDRRTLGSEADEVFHTYRDELATSARSRASMWPTVCRWQLRWSGWTPVLVAEQSTDFSYVRAASGEWKRQH